MDDEYDAGRVADLVLPLGSPYNPETVVRAATTMNELVRRLNHATFHNTALHYPSQLYRTVGGLRDGLNGLNQTLRQLANRLDRWAADPLTGHDRDDDPSATCLDAADHLHRAAAALGAVTRALDVTHGLTSHLELDEPDEEHTAHQAFPPIAAANPSTPSTSTPQPPPAPGRSRTR